MSDILDSSDSRNLEMNGAAKNFLVSAANWGTFLSIFGFVMIGLILLVGLSFSSKASSLDGESPGVMIFSVLFACTLNFFPNYYLYSFSSKAKKAIESNDPDNIAKAFESLRGMFRFVGVLTIIMLSIYAAVWILFGGGLIDYIR